MYHLIALYPVRIRSVPDPYQVRSSGKCYDTEQTGRRKGEDTVSKAESLRGRATEIYDRKPRQNNRILKKASIYKRKTLSLRIGNFKAK